jgi:hypothetical protein
MIIWRSAVAVVIGMVALISLAATLPAEAASCAAGLTCDVELTFANTQELNAGGIDIQVHIDNTGSVTTLTVQFQFDGITNTPLGIDEFYYGSSSAIASTTGGFADSTKWNFDGGQADGFGTFASLKNTDPGGTGGISSPIVFTLSSLVTSFAETTETGAEFAAHIRYSGGCSGFVADAPTTSLTSNSNCGIVGEPTGLSSALFLLGSGLVGMNYLGRRWRKLV